MNDAVTWLPVSVDLRAGPVPASGQPSAAEPSSAEQFVRGIYPAVSAAGGALPDWNAVRAFFLKEAAIVLRTSRTGTNVLTLEGFIKDFVDFYERPRKMGDLTRTPRDTGFAERVVRARTWEYGDLAHVLVLYEAEIVGWGRPPQQGVDSWALVRRDGRWWVASVTNEVVTPDRPVPPELR
jgi:hypothetical protein